MSIRNCCNSFVRDTFLLGSSCVSRTLLSALMHCDIDNYIVNADPYGNLAYKGYCYIYEYSPNGGTSWIPYGGNSWKQLVPGFIIAAEYNLRVRIGCTCDSIDTIHNLNYSFDPIYNGFVFYSIDNATPKLLKKSPLINPICSGNELRIFNPNSDFLITITFPDASTHVGNNQTFTIADLIAQGEDYQVTIEDLTGSDCDSLLDFILCFGIPVAITGGSAIPDFLSLCYQQFLLVYGGDDFITLTATAGFDSYLWSTGETTQSIDISTTGTYSVIAKKCNAECSRTDSIIIGSASASVPIVLTNNGGDCLIFTGGVYRMLSGSNFDFTITNSGNYTSYGWFGAPLDPSNTFNVNGNIAGYVFAVNTNGQISCEQLTVSEWDISELFDITELTPCPNGVYKFDLINGNYSTFTIHLFEDGIEIDTQSGLTTYTFTHTNAGLDYQIFFEFNVGGTLCDGGVLWQSPCNGGGGSFFRITDESDFRITDEGDRRITT